MKREDPGAAPSQAAGSADEQRGGLPPPADTEPAAGSVPAVLTAEERQTLVRTAFRSIETGVLYRQPIEVDAADYPARLRLPEATFVTIRRSTGELVGCIGSLEPRRPLIVDVARNAFAAAFEDPRSPGVSRGMLADLRVSISRLTPMVRIEVDSEDELRAVLKPGVDGVVLRDGHHRSTFLPAVWETLKTPETFLAQLKRKAGLPEDHWSNTIEFDRYAVESIP